MLNNHGCCCSRVSLVGFVVLRLREAGMGAAVLNRKEKERERETEKKKMGKECLERKQRRYLAEGRVGVRVFFVSRESIF